MSLHINLAPEAQAQLQAQKKRSTITSLAISLLVLTLVGGVLAFYMLPDMVRESPTIVTYESNLKETVQMDERTVNTSTDRRPSTPGGSPMAKVIAAKGSTSMGIPVPDVAVASPSLDFGNGNGFGKGWGDGNGDGAGGGGGAFAGIPVAMKKRCSKEDRLGRLLDGGGTPQCDDAVIKGLDWLQATQNSDGSWSEGGHPAAMTGFALLAFLGHCETPLSPKYGDTVLRAITYLVNLGMQSDGKLSTSPVGQSFPYEHAIATYAIAEAATFCKQVNVPVPNLFEVTQKAGQFIIQNQHKTSGGWDYNYATNSGRGGDLSVTAWQLQALKACHHTGLEFRDMRTAVNKATRYIIALSCADGGFGYDRPNAAPFVGYRTLTGAGVLCLQIWDKGSTTSASHGAKYIEKNTRFVYQSEFADLYGHYYECQAMMNRGGNQWKKYNLMFRDQLLSNQSSDGSWPAPGGGGKLRSVGNEVASNTTYRTCLSILMLEVYYRFLPSSSFR